MAKINVNRYYNSRDIYDTLIFNSVSLEEYKNNKVVIKSIGDTIESIMKKDCGYTLMTISIGKTRNTVLMIPFSFNDRKACLIASMSIESELETPLSFKIEEDNNEDDLMSYISTISDEHRELSEDDIVSTMIVKTLKGYRINKQVITTVVDRLQNFGEHLSNKVRNESDMVQFNPRELELFNHTLKSIQDAKTGIRQKITKFIDVNKVTEWAEGEINFGNLDYSGLVISISTVKDVIELGNRRLAVIENVSKAYDERYYNVESTRVQLYTYNQGRSHIEVNDAEQYYEFRTSGGDIGYAFRGGTIGYNFLDKGRTFVSIHSNDVYRSAIFTLSGVDPEVNKEHLTYLKNAIVKESIAQAKLHVQPGNMFFPVKGSQPILLSQYTKGNTGYSAILKGLKVLADEYKYIVKREKSDGQDISVTDEITYMHGDGKLICNDFSIATDSESLKADIYDFCKNAIRKHYKDPSYTSQNIMDTLLDNIFRSINSSLMSGKLSNKFDIIFNDKVIVEIEANKGKNNFSYVNEHRVNKSEIMPILKEMTCYRDQTVADTFIANIAKIGLSVYIGITSGYKLQDHLFRFKKGTKRSEFKLCIDDTEIDLKGKKILNHLFEYKIGKRNLTKNIISDVVYSSSETPYDYIKYRLLIDESYKLFIQRSKEFLDKKVEDTGSEHVTYHETHKNKLMSAVKVQGSSGNAYVIAYDSENSFVYMNPEEKDANDDGPVYAEGKYICMIDQSSIKSSIGYDTVISKMMALKHDSTVAASIYNLEDELNQKE